jgi:hypothetical protein
MRPYCTLLDFTAQAVMMTLVRIGVIRYGRPCVLSQLDPGAEYSLRSEN